MRPELIEAFRDYPSKAPVLEGLNAPIAPLLPKRVMGLQEKNKRQKLWDRQGGKCAYCDEPFTHERSATLDHVKPKSKGGSNRFDNFVLACQRCNGMKGDLDSLKDAMQRIRMFTAFVENLHERGYLQ